MGIPAGHGGPGEHRHPMCRRGNSESCRYPFQHRTREKDKNGLNRKKLPPNKMFFLVSHDTVKFLHGQIVRVESITLHAFCLET